MCSLRDSRRTSDNGVSFCVFQIWSGVLLYSTHCCAHGFLRMYNSSCNQYMVKYSIWKKEIWVCNQFINNQRFIHPVDPVNLRLIFEYWKNSKYRADLIFFRIKLIYFLEKTK